MVTITIMLCKKLQRNFILWHVLVLTINKIAIRAFTAVKNYVAKLQTDSFMTFVKLYVHMFTYVRYSQYQYYTQYNNMYCI